MQSVSSTSAVMLAKCDNIKFILVIKFNKYQSENLFKLLVWLDRVSWKWFSVQSRSDRTVTYLWMRLLLSLNYSFVLMMANNSFHHLPEMTPFDSDGLFPFPSSSHFPFCEHDPEGITEGIYFSTQCFISATVGALSIQSDVTLFS